MRIRHVRSVIICCGAVLSLCTACTAAAPKGPNVTVSTPSVGRPQPPSSVQAALSSEAFTPYAALGQSNNDGLAPGESGEALSSACLTAAGYPNSGNVPFGIRLGPANLGFSQPWGAWGYLGAAEAQQYGFRVPPGSALSELGIDAPGPGANPASLPQAEQAAIGKCATIVQNFTNAVQNGALAGIEHAEQRHLQRRGEGRGGQRRHAGLEGLHGEERLQLHAAGERVLPGAADHVRREAGDNPRGNGQHRRQPGADRDGRHGRRLHRLCGPGRDLLRRPGQLRAADRQRQPQALTTAVQQYRAAYAKELNKLPGLLKTASAQPFPSARPGQPSSAAG